MKTRHIPTNSGGCAVAHPVCQAEHSQDGTGQQWGISDESHCSHRLELEDSDGKPPRWCRGLSGCAARWSSGVKAKIVGPKKMQAPRIAEIRNKTQKVLIQKEEEGPDQYLKLGHRSALSQGTLATYYGYDSQPRLELELHLPSIICISEHPGLPTTTEAHAGLSEKQMTIVELPFSVAIDWTARDTGGAQFGHNRNYPMTIHRPSVYPVLSFGVGLFPAPVFYSSHPESPILLIVFPSIPQAAATYLRGLRSSRRLISSTFLVSAPESTFTTISSAETHHRIYPRITDGCRDPLHRGISSRGSHLSIELAGCLYPLLTSAFPDGRAAPHHRSRREAALHGGAAPRVLPLDERAGEARIRLRAGALALDEGEGGVVDPFTFRRNVASRSNLAKFTQEKKKTTPFVFVREEYPPFDAPPLPRCARGVPRAGASQAWWGTNTPACRTPTRRVLCLGLFPLEQSRTTTKTRPASLFGGELYGFCSNARFDFGSGVMLSSWVNYNALLWWLIFYCGALITGCPETSSSRPTRNKARGPVIQLSCQSAIYWIQDETRTRALRVFLSEHPTGYSR
ncbi:hypothetical protein FB451DRAFT_1465253 [Mycena latifolia]|nr:hypothetical protein FB451DRAFT_1465253 [Mycena latifolia]